MFRQLWPKKAEFFALRRESANSKTLPSPGMLKKYAEATGHKLNITFSPA